MRESGELKDCECEKDARYSVEECSSEEKSKKRRIFDGFGKRNPRRKR